MKKITSILLMASLLLVSVLSMQRSEAQIVSRITPGKVALDSVDTTSAILPIDANTQSVQMGALKTSGTVAGKIYFMGLSLDGGTYVKLDSMTVANTSPLQYKLITMGQRPFIYAGYKFWYVSTDGIWVPKAWVLRRSQ